ncbi:MAG: hypothetical protein EXR74_02650 [Bdellovibrionales bacterium]|nr:hypothetical protein [Bdellovibrionales bacterium]
MTALNKKKLTKVDCFYWEEFDALNYKLIYYDPQGNKTEKVILKEFLDDTLKIFDGKTHLLKRTSGAYSPATPIQFLIYHNPAIDSSKPMAHDLIRINAQFIDLERNNNRTIVSETMVAHNKNVHPSSFRLMTKGEDPFKHQYWLDLGHTIIRISVFDFFRDNKDIVKALFVETDDLEKIAAQNKGKKTAIAIYSAPEAVLRMSLPEESQAVVEAHTLSRSLISIKRSLDQHVPKILEFGPPLLIPTGSTVDVLNHYLRVCHDPHSLSMKRSFLSALEKPNPNKGEILMPFGVFERV